MSNTPQTATGAHSEGERTSEAPDDVNLLLAEHQRFAKLITLLEEQIAQFHRGDQPDYELLRDIFDYMTNYPDRFHHPKEDLVFARLAARKLGAKAHVIELQRQHRLIAASGTRFLANLEAALNGTILPRAAVEEPALEYINLYRTHMALEEEQLFPLARSILVAADWEDAHNAIGTGVDPVFVDRVEDRYRALHRQIALAAACCCTEAPPV